MTVGQSGVLFDLMHAKSLKLLTDSTRRSNMSESLDIAYEILTPLYFRDIHRLVRVLGDIFNMAAVVNNKDLKLLCVNSLFCIFLFAPNRQ